MKILEVPYFSQRDNEIDPTRTCNVTSAAMCLKFCGIVGDGSFKQLEDQLSKRAEKLNLNKYVAADIKYLIETYPGMKDDFTNKGSLALIRQAIDQGKPCILHTMSTKSGHIFVVRGYDDDGFWVNDPWGEWFPWEYQKKSGERLHYSNRMMGAVCSTWDQRDAIALYESQKFNPEKAENMDLHRIYRAKT